MRTRWLWALVIGGAFVVGGCDQAGEDDENVDADTTVVEGVDTVGGEPMATEDTVVRTTETDTIQGEADRDTARDTTPNR